jgi:uncharacterized RDD family membrane protein YckC
MLSAASALFSFSIPFFTQGAISHEQSWIFGRFVAYLVDRFIMGILAWIVMLVFGGIIGATSGTDSGFLSFIAGTMSLLMIVVMFLFQFLYFGYFWSKNGQSVGMKLLNMKVVGRDGGPLSFVRAGLRGSVGYWISSIIFGLGFIWAAFDSEKEAWHDKIFDTWVVTT